MVVDLLLKLKMLLKLLPDFAQTLIFMANNRKGGIVSYHCLTRLYRYNNDLFWKIAKTNSQPNDCMILEK